MKLSQLTLDNAINAARDAVLAAEVLDRLKPTADTAEIIGQARRLLARLDIYADKQTDPSK